MDEKEKKCECNQPEISSENCILEQNIVKELFKAGNRVIVQDKYIDKDIKDDLVRYKNKIYVRLNAKGKKFTKVSFEHCIFDSCYMNSCVFDTCDFTGCRFVGCNLHLSKFVDCSFRYAVFERTLLEDDQIFKEAPKEDNLKMRFARSLRMNFQQVGDAKAVNHAILLELSATSSYLYKSWTSTEKYYKDKYGGLARAYQFSKWVSFKFFDIIWGNGESITKLARTIFIFLIGVAFFDMHLSPKNMSFIDFPNSFEQAVGLFFGSVSYTSYPSLFVSLIIAVRLISLALLTSILVKRLGRR